MEADASVHAVGADLLVPLKPPQRHLYATCGHIINLRGDTVVISKASDIVQNQAVYLVACSCRRIGVNDHYRIPVLISEKSDIYKTT